MNLCNTSVAVVDDDPAILRSLENLLESAGYSVRTFPSAQTLLDSDLREIDCLIADIGMPGMDGFELHRLAKRRQPTLPVFLITGRHEIADQERAREKSIAGFFRKPFDGAALLSAVGDALGI